MFASQLVSVSAAKSDPATPRSHALGRAAQQREREWAARKKERATRHRKRRERRSEEYRLCEQQVLSSPVWRCTHGGGRLQLTVAGMAPRRPSVMTWPCKVTGKHFEGVAGPPSRARHVSRTGVGGAASQG
jgi:hypothetical protein